MTMAHPYRFPVASEPTLHTLPAAMHRPHFCTVGRSFVGVGAAWRLRGPAAAMRASAGAVIPLLRGAPLGATAGRRGAGFFMATDCRTADGGDVVTADRTPRSAAASRRPCLDRSSPCWRRDKARQDEATRPGDKNRMWESKQRIFRSVWILHCSCGLRNLCVCVTLYSSA